ncbi:MAG: hypothetical protein QOD00_2574 [Blastocatellia bacterium]|jgi:photosystem II stability/assembly factor-like uncharacterized protein|nr:hypothetical protein [Blastocatellia bacterium]
MERTRLSKIGHQIAKTAIQLVTLWAMIVMGTAAAQTGGVWQAQAPLPVGEALHGVDMVSTTEAWAVGESGIILHSTDGGTGWAQQSSGTNAQLNALRFLDALHGWAVGNAVLYTTDGGQTWQQGTRSGNLSGLYDVDFVDTSFGWACGGGVVMKTTDGGKSWTPQSVPTASFENLISIDFVDRNRGWTVGASGIILGTTNGGATWTRLTSGTNAFLTGVSFQSTFEGWAVGGNVVLHTTNGGASWAQQTVPANTWVRDILMLDAQNGWAVGQLQNIIHTTDGSATWTTQMGGLNSAPYNNYYLNSVRFGDSLHGIAVGDGGNLFNTSDGGQTWTPRQNGSTTITNRLTATDANHAWSANTKNEILYTTNGGQFWNRVNLPGGVGFDVTDVDFTDNLNGWACTNGGSATIWRTGDGGRTWQDARAPVVSLISIDTFDGRTIVAVGADSSNGAAVVRSTDGGASWTVRNFPQYGPVFRDVQMVNASVGWIVGGSSILKTTDGGATWVLQYQDFNDHFSRISFADALNGWATSVFGVLHSINGGQTWTLQIPGLNSDTGPDAIHAVTPNVAWVCDFDGAVARTTDGGATWVRENVTTTTNFMTLFFLDADYGWIGGQRNTTGGPATIASIYRRTSTAPQQFSINGRVTNQSGAGLSQVNLRVLNSGGSQSGATQSDSNGNYTLTGLPAGGDYTVTPSLTGYAFTPSSQRVKNLSGDENMNFTGTSTAPVTCSYSISPSSQNFPAGGGAGNISLTTPAGCVWKTRTAVSWIKLGDSDGTGNANISFAVAANVNTTPRTATVDVQGQTFNITQDAAPFTCRYTISPASIDFGSNADQASVLVTSSSGCNWVAVSNDGWMSITSGSAGAGNGTMTFTVTQNPGAYRTGSITIAGQTLSVSQKGSSVALQRSSEVKKAKLQVRP